MAKFKGLTCRSLRGQETQLSDGEESLFEDLTHFLSNRTRGANQRNVIVLLFHGP
jgi:hypothetical protein